MVAAFADLEELGAPRIGPFAPFIGGGVGIARNRIGETRMVFPKTMTIVPGASRTDVAWMATAGLETALSERATLGIAWRYTDLGTVETGRDTARVVRHSDGTVPWSTLST